MKNKNYRTNYPEGDFLVRIKNAAMAGNNKVVVNKNKFIESIARLLKKEKYLSEIKTEDQKLLVTLSYHKKEPILTDLKLISRPGLRVYWGADELSSKKDPYIYIVSTSKGVMASRDAIKNNLGGEVIAKVQ